MKHPEPVGTTDATQRVLSHANLVDLRMACERAWEAVPETIFAFRTNDGEGMMDALGAIMSGLVTIRSELRLDDVDDDDPQGMDLASITSNGGRADG